MQDLADAFEPLPSDAPMGDNSSGRPSVSAADLARRAAAEAVRGVDAPTTPPGTKMHQGRPDQQALPDDDRSHLDFSQLDDEPAIPAEHEPQQTSQEPLTQREREYQATLTSDDYARLADMGINLPVDPADVPPEFLPHFEELVQSMEDLHTNSQSYITDALNAIEEVNDFKKRLSTPEGQERMLLTLAMTKPEVFGSAMEKAQRMQDDPHYAAALKTQLESQIRLEAAERMERAYTTAQRQQKGQQVENRMHRTAKRLGIDPEMAKKMVVSRIYENEARTGRRDITFQEVDEVLEAVAQMSGRRQPQRTPQAQQQHQRAPTTPTQGVGADRGSGDHQHAAPGTRQQPMDLTSKLRQAVRHAGERVRSSGL